MAREINLKGYLPDVLREIKDFQELTEAENPEFDLLLEKIDIIVNNCFIDSLDEYGCARWEGMLGLISKETDSLATRIFKIKAALIGDRPYTMNSLRTKLTHLCGEDNYGLRYADEAYTITVSLALQVKEQYDYLSNLLKEIVPANIMIELVVLYNTHGKLKSKPFIHDDMAVYTHKQLSEEVL